MHDLVIRAGTVVDGTGQPGFTADIAVDNATITEIGKITASGRQELDADVSSSPPASSTFTPTMTAKCPGTPTSRRRFGTA